MLVAERHPEGIRSLVFTSPMDPFSNFLEGGRPGFEQALDRIGQACSADRGCAEQIGDVDAAIEATVDRLAAQPEEVTVTRSDGEQITLTYDPTTFLDSLFALFYSTDGVARLPALVDAAEAGDLEPLASIAGEIERSFVDSTALGMELSMGAPLRAPRSTPTRANSTVTPSLGDQRSTPPTGSFGRSGSHP